jgi:hypothetical protein
MGFCSTPDGEKGASGVNITGRSGMAAFRPPQGGQPAAAELPPDTVSIDGQCGNKAPQMVPKRTEINRTSAALFSPFSGRMLYPYFLPSGRDM